MQNPFKRLGAFFSSVVEHGGESVIGVDIGSAYLKVVQLRRKAGKAVLETYGSLALGPYARTDIGRATRLPPPVLAEALRDLIREAHVTTTRAALSIPFSSSLVTTIDVPALPERELAAAIPIEARKYVPVPISEVNLDWWIIPEEGAVHERGSEETPSGNRASVEGSEPTVPSKGELERQGMLKILIAAIHNEAMHRFDDVVRRAGIESSFFEIELFSTMRALFPQDLNAHAVLDLGAGETKLYVIDRGLLRLSHIISHGAQDLTLALSRALNLPVSEAEKLKRRSGLTGSGTGRDAAGSLRGMLDVVFAETNRVLRSFTHRFGRTVTDLILSGGGANLPGLPEFAQHICAVKVSRADPFTHVEAPAFLNEVLQGVGPEFSVALGVAFRKLQETA